MAVRTFEVGIYLLIKRLEQSRVIGVWVRRDVNTEPPGPFSDNLAYAVN